MDQACTLTSEQRRIEYRKNRIAHVKRLAYMFAHKWFWRALYMVKLARLYSRFMCRHNWYRTFFDGRCMWCGNKHGIIK